MSPSGSYPEDRRFESDRCYSLAQQGRDTGEGIVGIIEGSKGRNASGAPASATFGTIAAEAANARTVPVQLKDHAGIDLANRGVVQMYVSTDATGDAPGDGALTIALTAGTDGAILPGADASARATFVSEADGDIDVVLTDSADGALSVYLHVILSDGTIASSGAIAFADDTP